MYAVDRRHKKIITTDQEFQHHGIRGQKWGIITKNVGVNYIPIGRRKSSDSESSQNRLSSSSKSKRTGQSVEVGKPISKEYEKAILDGVTKNIGPYITKEMIAPLYSNKKIQNAKTPEEAGKIAGNICWNNCWDYMMYAKENYYIANKAHKSFFGYKNDEYNQKLDYDFHKKDSIDLTKQLGYTFKSKNAPEIRMTMYNNLPCGVFGFYNNKVYDFAEDAIIAYEQDGGV